MLKKRIKQKNTPESGEERRIKRYLGIIKEDVDEKFSTIVEILNSHTKTLDSHTKTLDSHTQILESHDRKLDSHTEMIGNLMVNMDIVKSDINIIKNDLKQKVDRVEFENLVKRVLTIEKKVLK